MSTSQHLEVKCTSLDDAEGNGQFMLTRTLSGYLKARLEKTQVVIDSLHSPQSLLSVQAQLTCDNYGFLRQVCPVSSDENNLVS